MKFIPLQFYVTTDEILFSFFWLKSLTFFNGPDSLFPLTLSSADLTSHFNTIWPCMIYVLQISFHSYHGRYFLYICSIFAVYLLYNERSFFRFHIYPVEGRLLFFYFFSYMSAMSVFISPLFIHLTLDCIHF